MHKYRVSGCWAAEGRFALLCSHGRHHLIRALNGLPQEGALLSGAKPHLGFGVLACPTSGVVFRVIFESINHASPVCGAHGLSTTTQARPDAYSGAAG